MLGARLRRPFAARGLFGRFGAGGGTGCGHAALAHPKPPTQTPVKSGRTQPGQRSRSTAADRAPPLGRAGPTRDEFDVLRHELRVHADEVHGEGLWGGRVGETGADEQRLVSNGGGRLIIGGAAARSPAGQGSALNSYLCQRRQTEGRFNPSQKNRPCLSRPNQLFHGTCVPRWSFQAARGLRIDWRPLMRAQCAAQARAHLADELLLDGHRLCHDLDHALVRDLVVQHAARGSGGEQRKGGWEQGGVIRSFGGTRLYEGEDCARRRLGTRMRARSCLACSVGGTAPAPPAASVAGPPRTCRAGS